MQYYCFTQSERDNVLQKLKIISNVLDYYTKWMKIGLSLIVDGHKLYKAFWRHKW